jgi:transcriptional regulator
MYIPRWFKEDRLSVLHEAIERISFGTLVTNSIRGLLASHIPMLIDGTRGEYGTLLGHIARGNSQWRDSSPETEALAMFVGTDAYISPTWYATTKQTGKVVPTWDYIAVHAHGRARFYDDSTKLLELVTRLTKKQEASFEEPWEVSKAPADYIASELKTIVGFEMPITRIEGKWKMSQNRSKEDRGGAVRGLNELGNESAMDVASEIEKFGTD